MKFSIQIGVNILLRKHNAFLELERINPDKKHKKNIRSVIIEPNKDRIAKSMEYITIINNNEK